jgi:hypothetical protein
LLPSSIIQLFSGSNHKLFIIWLKNNGSFFESYPKSGEQKIFVQKSSLSGIFCAICSISFLVAHVAMATMMLLFLAKLYID